MYEIDWCPRLTGFACKVRNATNVDFSWRSRQTVFRLVSVLRRFVRIVNRKIKTPSTPRLKANEKLARFFFEKFNGNNVPPTRPVMTCFRCSLLKTDHWDFYMVFYGLLTCKKSIAINLNKPKHQFCKSTLAL